MVWRLNPGGKDMLSIVCMHVHVLRETAPLHFISLSSFYIHRKAPHTSACIHGIHGKLLQAFISTQEKKCQDKFFREEWRVAEKNVKAPCLEKVTWEVSFGIVSTLLMDQLKPRSPDGLGGGWSSFSSSSVSSLSPQGSWAAAESGLPCLPSSLLPILSSPASAAHPFLTLPSHAPEERCPSWC